MTKGRKLQRPQQSAAPSKDREAIEHRDLRTPRRVDRRGSYQHSIPQHKVDMASGPSDDRSDKLTQSESQFSQLTQLAQNQNHIIEGLRASIKDLCERQALVASVPSAPQAPLLTLQQEMAPQPLTTATQPTTAAPPPTTAVAPQHQHVAPSSRTWASVTSSGPHRSAPSSTPPPRVPPLH